MKILAFGDSLTEGFITTETVKYHPYTTSLKRMLKKKNPKTIIDNHGVSGETTASMIKRIKTINKIKYYDMVILLAGTNDLSDSKITISAIVKNVIELHKLSRSLLGAKETLCLSLPEVTNGTLKHRKLLYNVKREQVNKRLRDYCKNTPNTYYVPFGEVFSETHLVGMGLFSGNGYHLSIKGSRKMAEFIAFFIGFI